MKNDYITIQYDVFEFFHFLYCNIPDNKCYKQKWGMLFFTHIMLMVHVLVCVRAIAHIKWRRLLMEFAIAMVIPGLDVKEK